MLTHSLILSRQEIRHRLLETEKILTDQLDAGNRRHFHHDLQDSIVTQFPSNTSGINSHGDYKYDINDESLLLLQRNLQRENPDSTDDGSCVTAFKPRYFRKLQ